MGVFSEIRIVHQAFTLRSDSFIQKQFVFNLIFTFSKLYYEFWMLWVLLWVLQLQLSHCLQCLKQYFRIRGMSKYEPV